LASSFEKVVGLDVSKTQIAEAKGQLVTSKFENVEFR
jgi:hypothetical protein